MKGFVLIRHDMYKGEYVYDVFEEEKKTKECFEKLIKAALKGRLQDDMGYTIEDILKYSVNALYTMIDDVVYETHSCDIHL